MFYIIDVGRKFLNIYNQKMNTSHSPKEFFDEVLFETIFNHPKHLWNISNSPFFNRKEKSNAECLETLHTCIDSGDIRCGTAIGFESKDKLSHTYSQVSDIDYNFLSDDIYCSWIGGALGVGVAGGYTILFNNPEVLWSLFKGWSVYRKLINDETIKLAPFKLNSWNGRWLNYYMGDDFDEDFDLNTLETEKFFKIKGSTREIELVKWVNIYFTLSTNFPDKELITNIHAHGQTNKSIGLIPFKMSTGNKVMTLYRNLYGEEKYLADKHMFEILFGRLDEVCTIGSVGFKLLKPKGLKEFIHNLKTKEKKKNNKENKDVIGHIYRTWLIAVLNDDRMDQKTKEISTYLIEYQKSGKGAVRKQLIEKELFEAKSTTSFYKVLSKMTKDSDDTQIPFILNLKETVQRLKKTDDFYEFMSLLELDYNLYNKTGV